MVAKNDIRYQARCKRCQTPIGDWAMKVPNEDRLCYDCRHHDIKDIPYKKDWTQEEENDWIRSHFK